MKISITYTEPVLERLKKYSANQRVVQHLVMLGGALPGEGFGALSAGFVSKDCAVAEAKSSVTGGDYTVHFSNDAVWVNSVALPGGKALVQVKSIDVSGHVLFSSPALPRKPRIPRKPKRTSHELLLQLCSHVVFPVTGQTVMDLAHRHDGLDSLHGLCGLAGLSGVPRGVVCIHNFRDLHKAIPALTAPERRTIRTWRRLDLRDRANPFTESWWEFASGTPDHDWKEVPMDRVLSLLTYAAEHNWEVFDRDMLRVGKIAIQNMKRLLYLYPPLQDAKDQIAAAEGMPFTRPIPPH